MLLINTDFDSDHFITRSDIELATQALTKCELSPDEIEVVCDKVLDEGDNDDDGCISFAEFQHVLLRSSDFLT